MVNLLRLKAYYIYCRPGLRHHNMGEFVYAVTAAESIILSSLFIGHKQR